MQKKEGVLLRGHSISIEHKAESCEIGFQTDNAQGRRTQRPFQAGVWPMQLSSKGSTWTCPSELCQTADASGVCPRLRQTARPSQGARARATYKGCARIPNAAWWSWPWVSPDVFFVLFFAS